MAKDFIHQTALNLLFEKIENGVFKVNQRLPSERDLAEVLGVSRGSLREVLRVLEQQGVIETRKDGRYLINNSSREEAQHLQSQMEISDLLEARSVLEDKIVELACERATEAEIAAIKEYLDKGLFELAAATTDTALDYDNLFHISVANAAHNMVFANIYINNLEVLQRIRRESMSSVRRRKAILEEHRMIYEAIRDRDSLMARLAARLHLRSIEETYAKHTTEHT